MGAIGTTVAGCNWLVTVEVSAVPAEVPCALDAATEADAMAAAQSILDAAGKHGWRVTGARVRECSR